MRDMNNIKVLEKRLENLRKEEQDLEQKYRINGDSFSKESLDIFDKIYEVRDIIEKVECILGVEIQKAMIGEVK